ncbi:hypothetical protein HKCCSP123_02220 [Rhodobacterales bacterium HKCCSP123]|nr:hypothetical protein [Rhodobacterales bacterium HKCCSP123]
MNGLGDRSRRQALAQLAAVAVAGLSIPAVSAQPVSRGALEAYVDILLPGGDGLPPASGLGIAPEIESLAPAGSVFRRLLSVGTDWLDGLQGGGFAALPASAQAQVVEWMAAAPYHEIPGRFYHVVRLFAAELYYTRPEARVGLPLELAPQPAGYPPPWGGT